MFFLSNRKNCFSVKKFICYTPQKTIDIKILIKKKRDDFLFWKEIKFILN